MYSAWDVIVVFGGIALIFIAILWHISPGLGMIGIVIVLVVIFGKTKEERKEADEKEERERKLQYEEEVRVRRCEGELRAAKWHAEREEAEQSEAKRIADRQARVDRYKGP